ncbi:FAD-dependent monooxygenase [Mesorhizobium sp. RMAD-H1]|uniref:FAD-dependent monooxygenase n=1 Tax=Mesorhizobium sp. RMAD-H1 TaxID=2587065 RepID=UPI001618D306|nr:FAD-dependent monooxygenase [Mesorhizobium sp. RMAD-H1]MBB2970444.1 salicylate hydroxylase [Mesorhizobium sp. RMAD-H1]
MTASAARQVVISGAGIAGLTAALALAAKDFKVTVFDKAPRLSEVGAGLQLAPNATRLLDRLRVLDRLMPRAVAPDALYLQDGTGGETLLRMALRDAAETRWNAPYIVCHRADLQAALTAAVREHPGISLRLGSNVVSHEARDDATTVRIDAGDRIEEHRGALLLGCDGVWSARRAAVEHDRSATFTGHIAWRASLAAEDLPQAFQALLPEANSVSAWLGRGVHFIVYPVKAGNVFNFVAITRGRDPGREWSSRGNSIALAAAFSGWHPAIHAVINAAAEHWTFWPLFQIDRPRFMLNRRVVLLGDAAHAMTPFAAQGAAMAIEDACALAAALTGDEADWPAALARFDQERLARVAAVARRGSLNRFAYHAAGPLALGRNMLLRSRSPERFLADLDWLYGYDGTGFS